MEKVITVFGSSQPKDGDADYQLAYECGKIIAEKKYTVCNGGYQGIMEATHRGCKSAGGKTIGITLGSFSHVKANPFCDEIFESPTLYERIKKLIDMGSHYVVLKGGTGTLAELGLVWELLNKQFLPSKQIIFVGDFWNPLLDLMCADNYFDCRLKFTIEPKNYIRRVSRVSQIGELI